MNILFKSLELEVLCEFFAKKPWTFLKPAGSLIRQKFSNNWEPEVTVRNEELHNTGFFWDFFNLAIITGGPGGGGVKVVK